MKVKRDIFYSFRILLFLASIFGIVFSSFAQSPDITWSKIYGDNDYERGNFIQPTSDGGFIIVGQTDAFYSGGSATMGNIWLVKTDSMGDTIWTKTFGSSGLDDGFSVIQTSDGGYLLTGATPSSNLAQEWDAWIIRTNSNGDTIWTKVYGGLGEEILTSVQETTTGEFIFAGTTSSYGSGEFDAWLFLTDVNGEITWTKTFGGIFSDYAHSVKQTLDGGYIITGRRLLALPGEPDLWIIRTDANGDSLWTRMFNGSSISNSFDEGRDVQIMSDSGFTVLGFTGVSAWLIRTDANGDTIWTKQYPGNGNSLQETSDGGFIIAGGNKLIRTDVSGESIWAKSINGTANSVLQTSDDGFITAGYQFSSGTKDDLWILRLDSENPSGLEDTGFNTPEQYKLSQNYPNPFNPSTTINFTIPYASFVSLKVFNSLGQEIESLVAKDLNAGTYNYNWDAKGLTSGIYFYKLQAGDFIETKKMILLK